MYLIGVDFDIVSVFDVAMTGSCRICQLIVMHGRRVENGEFCVALWVMRSGRLLL